MLLCNICRLPALPWYLSACCQGAESTTAVSTAAFQRLANEPDVLTISLDVMDEVGTALTPSTVLASGIWLAGTEPSVSVCANWEEQLSCNSWNAHYTHLHLLC